jgi:tRNA modification GTPase
MRRLPGDTIAAISTALGPGAIAIVRLSGQDALEVGDRVFRGGTRLSSSPSHTVHYGRVVGADGSTVDEVLATVMRSPNTYTTEHMIEFGCHGGSLPARAVLASCLEAGARQAGPGEFTERAFMNGRIDLIQAEAVQDVVSARTTGALGLALGQLSGSLSSGIDGIRDVLLEMRAGVEAAIDFPDDVDEGKTRAETARLGAEARVLTEGLLRSSELGVAIREGLAVAIVGKPNVGKSSLMNALLRRERSIVTEEPGTTRDAVEDCLNIDGVQFRLIDTAGWRRTADVAERAGVERARAAALGADLCMLVLDLSNGVGAEDREITQALTESRAIVVCNKVDLIDAAASGDVARQAATEAGLPETAAPAVAVSATRGDGLEALRELMVRTCLGLPAGETATVTNVRHVHALRGVVSSLDSLSRIVGEAPLEIVGTELAQATHALGEISGETTPEDVIERIFERFCVGK